MPVNKENMRLWVAALLSNRFIQGRAMLKSKQSDGTFRHCCLGVACEIAMEHGVELEQIQLNGDAYGAYRFDDNSTNLPLKVVDWLGVDKADPVVQETPLENPCDAGCCQTKELTAIDANDGQQWPFEQIANALVSYYKLEEDGEESVAPHGSSDSAD